MSMTVETSELLKWLGKSDRSPIQTHGLNESDSEVVALDEERYLTTTVDSISDEILVGLYNEPFTLGWMTAQTSLSDLAAVGADPIGILFSSQWGIGTQTEFKAEVARGLHAALAESRTFLLGGDTGTAQSTVLTSVGIGIRRKPLISRIGITPGDYLCLTGKTGCGPALAFQLLSRLLPNRSENPSSVFPESFYRPRARLESGRKLANIVHALMDTSDGVLSTLHTLAELNNVGLDLEWNPETLDERAVSYCQKAGIPLWLLWLGEHGDFQLISAIPPDRLKEAQSLCPDLHPIGRATARKTAQTQNSTLRVPTSSHPISFALAEFISLGKNLSPQELAHRFDHWAKTLKEAGFP